MKINFSLKILISALMMTVAFNSCVESDEYIDWKVINNDWIAAHRKDVSIIQSMNWLETNSEIYKNSTEPFQVSESGLSYRFIRKGNPAERTPNPTSRIYATYEGKYIDGTTFDKGKKANFSSLNGLILSHQEVLLKMRRGDIVEIIAPYELCYGEKGQGIIPPYSVLIFRLELTDVIF